MPESPPDKILIDAMLNGLKQRVMFLVDSDIPNEDIERLTDKTKRLSFQALVQQFGDDAARKFFVVSENPWLLRTTFGGWVFFYPNEVLTPQTSMESLGTPDFVYWSNAEGVYARVPWQVWANLREAGNVLRPAPQAGPKSVWERLLDPS